MFEVRLNMMRIIERHDMLVFLGSQLPGASVAAVNDTLIELRDLTSKALTTVVNAPAAEVDSRVLIDPASRVSRIEAAGRIVISDRLMAPKMFGPTQETEGVSYSPVKGKTHLVRSAFGPNIPRLGRHVWKRETPKRVPIKKVPGFNMSLSSTVASVVKRVGAQANEILMRNIDIQVSRFLRNLESGRTTFGPTYINRQRGVWLGWGRFGSLLANRANTARRR